MRDRVIEKRRATDRAPAEVDRHDIGFGQSGHDRSEQLGSGVGVGEEFACDGLTLPVLKARGFLARLAGATY